MIFRDSDTFFVERAWLQPEAESPAGLQPSLINQKRKLIEAAPFGSGWSCHPY